MTVKFIPMISDNLIGILENLGTNSSSELMGRITYVSYQKCFRSSPEIKQLFFFNSISTIFNITFTTYHRLVIQRNLSFLKTHSFSVEGETDLEVGSDDLEKERVM